MKKSKIHKEDISRLHKDRLGMDVPEGFFKKSKEDILNAVIQEEQPRQQVFWLRPLIAYPMAAALVIALAITIFINNNKSDLNNKITDTDDIEFLNGDFSNKDFLVSSLMVSDSEMHDFLDRYIMDEIIVEVDRQEQEIDDLMINSLFVEDSLIDNFIDENLFENVVL
jgi:hypothetical protein